MALSTGFASSYKNIINEKDLNSDFFYIKTSLCGKFTAILCDYSIYIYSSTPYLHKLGYYERPPDYPAHANKAYWDYNSKYLYAHTKLDDTIITYCITHIQRKTSGEGLYMENEEYEFSRIKTRTKSLPCRVVYVGKKAMASLDSSIINYNKEKPPMLSPTKTKASFFFDEELTSDMLFMEEKAFNKVSIRFDSVLTFPFPISSLAVSCNHILFGCANMNYVLSTHISDFSELDGIVDFDYFALIDRTNKISVSNTNATFVQSHLQLQNASDEGKLMLNDVYSYNRNKDIESEPFIKYDSSHEKWEPLLLRDTGVKLIELNESLGLLGVVFRSGLAVVLAWSSPFKDMFYETSWLYTKSIGLRLSNSFVTQLAFNRSRRMIALLSNQDTLELLQVDQIKSPYININLNNVPLSLHWSLDGEVVAVRYNKDFEVYDYAGKSILQSKKEGANSKDICSLEWICMDLQLAILSSNKNLITIPYYRDSVVRGGTTATFGAPFGHYSTKVFIGAEDLLLLSPNSWNCKSYDFIKVSFPQNMFTKSLDWPIRIATANARYENILVTSQSGIALYSLRTEEWQYFKAQDKFCVGCLPVTWYTNTMLCVTLQLLDKSYDDADENKEYHKYLSQPFKDVIKELKTETNQINHTLYFIDTSRSFDSENLSADSINLIHKPIHLFVYNTSDRFTYTPPSLKKPNMTNHLINKLNLHDPCRPCGNAVDSRELPHTTSKYAPDSFSDTPILAIYDCSFTLCGYRLCPPHKVTFKVGERINTRVNSFIWTIQPLWKVDLSSCNWIEHPLSLHFFGSPHNIIVHHVTQSLSALRIYYHNIYKRRKSCKLFARLTL